MEFNGILKIFMANAENNLVEIDLKKEYIAFNRKSNYLL
jgi:hypothetical protein